MVENGKYYFLSRPRRFGKSLLLSTLEAYFMGRRELFQGLAMERLETEWAVYPVLRLDLNSQNYDTPESLDMVFDDALSRWEEVYGSSPTEKTPSMRFGGVIRRACEQTGRGAVVLVDEYDKPIVQNIGNEALQDKFRQKLKAFYGVMKSCDEWLRFGILTGVGRFSHMSIFSDLNNLIDLSLDRQTATICGITEQELETELGPDIQAMAQANGMSMDDCMARLRRMYDGYHFAEDTPGVYNPFSIFNALRAHKFGSYWFETGTPTMLVRALQQNDYDLSSLSGAEATEADLKGVETYKGNPIPLLFQTGYLTIKSYDARFGTYVLDFPNKEVEEGFFNFLVSLYQRRREGGKATPFNVRRFVADVERGDVDSLLTRLQSFLADMPYELVSDRERHYQNALYMVFRLMGFYVEAEYRTSRGRIDLTVQTKDYIYVMEFKLDGTADEALAQIDERGYAAPFASDPRTLYKVGVNFSATERNIERWVVSEG